MDLKNLRRVLITPEEDSVVSLYEELLLYIHAIGVEVDDRVGLKCYIQESSYPDIWKKMCLSSWRERLEKLLENRNVYILDMKIDYSGIEMSFVKIKN